MKIFLFPYTKRTEHFFSSNFANFLFLHAHENARYAKMVFWLRISKLRSFYKYIKRLLLGSKNGKKNFQKDWKNK